MITEFINYLENIKGYAQNTTKAYEQDLRHFAIWAKANQPGTRWSTLTRETLDAYITSQSQQGLKPTTTNRRLSAISALYDYMKRQGYQVTDPTRYESRRKEAQTEPNTLDWNDLKKAYDNSYGVTRVLIGLLACTGIRIQEALDLCYQDINFNTGVIKINAGKGNKQRYVRAPREYLETLEELSKTNAGHIFALDQRDARRLIAAGVKPYTTAKQVSPHTIRHTYATELAARGANVAQLAKALGHADIRTSQKYIDLAQVSRTTPTLSLA